MVKRLHDGTLIKHASLKRESAERLSPEETKGTGFLDLDPCAREMIYRQCFVSSHEIVPTRPARKPIGFRKKAGYIGLIRTCKTIAAEASRSLYNDNAFLLEPTDSQLARRPDHADATWRPVWQWLNKIGPANRQRLRFLTLLIHARFGTEKHFQPSQVLINILTLLGQRHAPLQTLVLGVWGRYQLREYHWWFLSHLYAIKTFELLPAKDRTRLGAERTLRPEMWATLSGAMQLPIPCDLDLSKVKTRPIMSRR